MKEYLKTFEQSNTRAWIWFMLIMMSLFFTVVSAFTQDIRGVVDNLFFAVNIYWIDQLEKYITTKNKESK